MKGWERLTVLVAVMGVSFGSAEGEGLWDVLMGVLMGVSVRSLSVKGHGRLSVVVGLMGVSVGREVSRVMVAVVVEPTGVSV